MDNITQSETKRFSARATLATLGVKLRQLNLFGSIRERVKIEQKVAKHTPLENWNIYQKTSRVTAPL